MPCDFCQSTLHTFCKCHHPDRVQQTQVLVHAWVRETNKRIFLETCSTLQQKMLASHYHVRYSKAHGIDALLAFWRQRVSHCVDYLLEGSNQTVNRVRTTRVGRQVAPPVQYTPPVGIPRTRVPKRVETALQGGLVIVQRKKKRGHREEVCPVCLEVRCGVRTGCGHDFCSCILRICMTAISNKMSAVCPCCRAEVNRLEVYDETMYAMWRMWEPVLSPGIIRFVSR